MDPSPHVGVDLTLLSVDETARCEHARLALRAASGWPRVSFTTSLGGGAELPSPDLERQLSLARVIAFNALKNSPLSPACNPDFFSCDLVAAIEGTGRFVGDSFGLSLLVGCLALGLGTSVRSEHLFSAGLPNASVAEGDSVDQIRLQPVTDAVRKLVAASTAGAKRLFVAAREEELVRAEWCHASGQPQYSCAPRPLTSLQPSALAGLVCLGIDLQPVLARLGTTPDAAILAIYCLFGCASSQEGGAVQGAIADALVRCRAAGVLEELDKTAGGASAASSIRPSQQVWNLALHAARGCEQDEARLTLVRSVIGTRPDESVLPDPGSTAPSAIERWSTGLAPTPDADAVLRVLDLTRISLHLPFDPAQLVGNVGRFTVRSLRLLFDSLDSIAPPSRSTQAALRRIVDTAICLDPDLAAELQSQFEALARLSPAGSAHAALAGGLARLSSLLRLDELRRPMLSGQDDGMTMTFACGASGDDVDVRTGLGRLNDLDVQIRVGTTVDVRLPSPVLLWEDSGTVAPYCRRMAFRDSDSTLSRIPTQDAQIIRESFGAVSPLTRIGFRVMDAAPAATVRWPPRVWPPAIDSIILVATLLRHVRDLEPRSLLDVGCGTGFLAIAASHLWPSLSHLTLQDIDAYAVRTAQLNVQADPIAGRCMVSLLARDCTATTWPKVDLVLSNPPYLPDRPIPVYGIELATNGTRLLTSIIEQAWRYADRTILVCSRIAWSEVSTSLLMHRDAYAEVRLLARSLVPFRIPWLEPLDPAEDRQSSTKRRYYEEVLLPRGLIDLDSTESRERYPGESESTIDEGKLGLTNTSGVSESTVKNLLDRLVSDSRGFRFWHEVRVLDLRSKSICPSPAS